MNYKKIDALLANALEKPGQGVDTPLSVFVRVKLREPVDAKIVTLLKLKGTNPMTGALTAEQIDVLSHEDWIDRISLATRATPRPDGPV